MIKQSYTNIGKSEQRVDIKEKAYDEAKYAAKLIIVEYERKGFSSNSLPKNNLLILIQWMM